MGVASDGELTVALDLELTEELRAEGLARDLVRVIQDARKDAGLAVTDRIEVAVEADGDVGDAFARHRDWIAGEVLATKIEAGQPAWAAGEPLPVQEGGIVRRVAEGVYVADARLDGRPVLVALRRVG